MSMDSVVTPELWRKKKKKKHALGESYDFGHS